MKRFLAFVIKEFFHIFRDSRTMLILFGMPVVQILLFGFVVTNDLKDMKIAFLDKSRDEVTREIREKIVASGYFIHAMDIEADNQIESAFRTGNIKQVVVFEKNFSKKLEEEGYASVQLIADASDANTANLIVNYTTGIINDYLMKMNLGNISMMPEVRMYFNPELKGVYMFVPGTMALILILVSAMMTSISITREKEFGTMETLLVSPLRPIQIILGKVTPYVSLSFVNAISIIALGYFVFGVPLEGNLFLLLGESMLYILLALSIGIFISTMTKTQQAAMFISLFALMIPTLLLSGFIFPIENMPEVLQYLSYIMPPRYFISILKDIMLKGVGLSYVWKDTLVLMVMTMFFIGMSVIKFKIRLE